MISEKVLKEAAENTHEILLRILPEPEDINYEFSGGFEEKIKEAMAMSDNKSGKGRDE